MARTHELVNPTWVDLDVQVARDRVLPAHWEGLDVLLLPRRQVLEGNLEVVRLHPESCRSTLGGPDRDVRVRHVLDAHAHGQRFVLCREEVKHDLAGDDYRRARSGQEGCSRDVQRWKEGQGYVQAVPPSGTSSSSPVPSSYRTTLRRLVGISSP